MTLLNGGSFGLEGGLLVTIILIAGTLILLRLPQKDAAPAAETVSPDLWCAEDPAMVQASAPSQNQEFIPTAESAADAGEADQ